MKSRGSNRWKQRHWAGFGQALAGGRSARRHRGPQQENTAGGGEYDRQWRAGGAGGCGQASRRRQAVCGGFKETGENRRIVCKRRSREVRAIGRDVRKLIRRAI